MIKLILYQKKYFADLVNCMEQLQDSLIEIDDLKRLCRRPGYGKSYTKNLLKKVERNHGNIIMAIDNGKVIGCAAGIIGKQEKRNLLECVPTRAGLLLELFVSKEYRSQGVGAKLLKSMEQFFKKNNCTVIFIGVFAPNKLARNFYQKHGYADRLIDQIKILK